MEEAKEELLQWSPIVRKHVDNLVMELTKRDALQLVYSAEDHAQALRIEAQAIYRCVSERWCCLVYNDNDVCVGTGVFRDGAFNYLWGSDIKAVMQWVWYVSLFLSSTLSGVKEASLNITSTSRGISDISANIQHAEDVALSVIQNASYISNLVSQTNKPVA